MSIATAYDNLALAKFEAWATGDETAVNEAYADLRLERALADARRANAARAQREWEEAHPEECKINPQAYYDYLLGE